MDFVPLNVNSKPLKVAQPHADEINMQIRQIFTQDNRFIQFCVPKNLELICLDSKNGKITFTNGTSFYNNPVNKNKDYYIASCQLFDLEDRDIEKFKKRFQKIKGNCRMVVAHGPNNKRGVFGGIILKK